MSTQESEYQALSSSLRDTMFVKKLVGRVVDAVGLDKSKLEFVTKSTAFEDNAAALSLATTKKITPRNRHIASKYHWFRSHVQTRANPTGIIRIEKIDTTRQIADIFTKNLTTDKFERARKALCGW